MIDAKTATPEQVSQLITEMKEAKNKAFMLQNQIDDIFIHSKNKKQEWINKRREYLVSQIKLIYEMENKCF